MNYSLVYSQLIFHAQLRETISEYVERHHIVPKALGGSNNQSNLVNLTAREHFNAHMLLAKIHGGSMWTAIIRFKYGNKKSYFNSRLYEIAKKQNALMVSKRFKRVPKSEETKQKMSLAAKGKTKPQEAIEKTRKALKGRKAAGKSLEALHAHRYLAWSSEAQAKKSAKLKGRIYSAETIQKMRNAIRPPPTKKTVDAFIKRVTGIKQTPEQITKRVASRRATLQSRERVNHVYLA